MEHHTERSKSWGLIPLLHHGSSIGHGWHRPGRGTRILCRPGLP